jgi:hypothetical protein
MWPAGLCLTCDAQLIEVKYCMSYESVVLKLELFKPTL